MAQTLQLKWSNDAYTVGAADVVDATGVAGMAGVAGTMDTAGQYAEARTSGVNTPEHVSPVFCSAILLVHYLIHKNSSAVRFTVAVGWQVNFCESRCEICSQKFVTHPDRNVNRLSSGWQERKCER